MSESDTLDTSATDADRYRVLLEASRRLSAKLSPDELYEAIYDETAGALDVGGFYLALHDQSRDLARVVFYADDGKGEHVDLSFRGSDSEVFRSKQGSLVEDDLEKHSLLVLGDDKTKLTRSAITAGGTPWSRVTSRRTCSIACPSNDTHSVSFAPGRNCMT